MDILFLERLLILALNLVSIPLGFILIYKSLIEWRLLRRTKYRAMSLTLLFLFCTVFGVSIMKAAFYYALVFGGSISNEIHNIRNLFESIYVLVTALLFLRLEGKINDN